jgi:hypothetical protein
MATYDIIGASIVIERFEFAAGTLNILKVLAEGLTHSYRSTQPQPHTYDRRPSGCHRPLLSRD